MGKIRILILGATGMLGHKLFAYLSRNSAYSVYAAARSHAELAGWLPEAMAGRVMEKFDAVDLDSVVRTIAAVRPDVVINGVGIIKQAPTAKDPLAAITVNALFPHRLAQVCQAAGARMIQISTDCVFDGSKGHYTESDIPGPLDLYGRTKLLGEVVDPHCLTLRTSIIGHELRGHVGLIDWFLQQEGKVSGFTKAIYSGLTTVELARVIRDYVIPQRERLQGLYHLSADPISKYDLLNRVATQYQKEITIEPDERIVADKSLDSSLFRLLTGYIPPSWPELVARMHEDFCQSPYSLNVGTRG